MQIKDLQKEVHSIAVLKGWWPLKDLDCAKPNYTLDLAQVNVAEKIALMHSELSEALEEWRGDKESLYFGPEGKPEGIAVELADCLIRILDFAAAYDLDLEEVIRIKVKYNSGRSYRHGGKRA